jgi:hypothetical protein
MSRNDDIDRARGRFEDWLSKDWKIAVFENHDLGSRTVGHRIALPFGAEQLAHAKIGEARAPDSTAGLGWRYILIAKPETSAKAIDLIFNLKRAA